MKNWKVVWVNITGSIFSNGFDTFEEMESWLTAQVKQTKPVAKKVTVFELYGNEYKIRHIYKGA